MYTSDDDTDLPDPGKRPWIHLKTTYDVESWINNYNRDLQRLVTDPRANGYGICFYLEAGGEIYMHTTGEGEVLLDVTPDAEWVGPVITATTQIPAPKSQIWRLPPEVLTQLIVGLSSLIGSTSMILQHDYKIRKFY